MSSALALLRLQQVDLRIDHIDARLEEIRTQLADDSEAVQLRAQISEKQAERERVDGRRKSAEAEAQTQRLKIQRTESSLYGGSVHNPKELQDLQADVTSLKKHLATVEDSELDSMALLEAADGELADLMARLSGIEDHMAAKREQLKIEQDSLLRSREDQEAERSAATGAIAPRVLQAYEALRKAKRGRAVAEIADNACAACGTILTAALQQSARHAIELVNCPSCGRILFAG